MGGPIGIFGKIPALGDFLRRDLPVDFTRIWDEWIQGGVTSARTALGDGWVEVYNSAPIWRFSLAPGVAGAAGVVGVVMPSLDRVGRAYPLTLASVLEGGAGPWRAMAENGAMLSGMERAALAALSPEAAAGDLESAVASLASVTPTPFALTQGRDGLAADAQLPPGGGVSGEMATAGLSADLGDRWLAERYGAASIWVSAFGDEAEELVFLHAGLPTASRFIALLGADAALWRAGEASAVTATAAAGIVS